MSKSEALDLLRYAMQLRMNGESAPGGNETWAEFDKRCEAFLRGVVKPRDISDGFHTFGELYDHRQALTAALMHSWPELSWKSKEHHPEDQPMYNDYFVVGMILPESGQITYHYNLTHWDDFRIPEISYAPKWDGHTAPMVVQRLLKWSKL